GPGNQSTRPRSMTSPLVGLLSRRKEAVLAWGNAPANASTAFPAAGPETRTTATPALPTPLETAKIVSLLLLRLLSLVSSGCCARLAWGTSTANAPPALPSARPGTRTAAAPSLRTPLESAKSVSLLLLSLLPLVSSGCCPRRCQSSEPRSISVAPPNPGRRQA